jgi:hypothetical protein
MRTGALSGYHAKAFTISPPRIDRVLEKRLAFALKLASGELPIQSILGDTLVELRNLEAIIRVFLASLRRNRSLVEFIDNVSSGNVRTALDLVKGFFGSGHVNTAKIVEIYSNTHRYLVPLHEFMRGVIYGDNRYYDPQSSPVANVFDVARFDPREHFLLPLAVGLLYSMGHDGGDEGFVDTARVYEQLQGLGFTPEQIDLAIIRGYRNNLIETSARRTPQANRAMPSALRATSIGVYHITRLCRDFSYVDAIVVDTPIFDDDVRRFVQDAESILERLDRAELFRRYLDDQWSLVKGDKVGFNWGNASTSLRLQIRNIRSRIS